MKYKASLIISIYDNVSFLKVVLDSLMYQTEKNYYFRGCGVFRGCKICTFLSISKRLSAFDAAGPRMEKRTCIE